MKIFVTMQRKLLVWGIGLSRQSSEQDPFNGRAFFGLPLFGGSTVSQLVCIFHVASGFMEYMECICATLATVLIFGCFMVIVFNRTVLFECIERIEELIKTRKMIEQISDKFITILSMDFRI